MGKLWYDVSRENSAEYIPFGLCHSEEWLGVSPTVRGFLLPTPTSALAPLEKCGQRPLIYFITLLGFTSNATQTVG